MEYIDNYNETIKALKQYIFDNIPREFIKQWEIERLDRMIASDDWNYLNFEFRNDVEGIRAEANLNVGLKYDFKLKEDCNGNLWNKYEIVVEINYPSYGSNSLVECKQRVGIIMSIVKFAESLEEKFNFKIYKLYKSKAEVDKDKQKAKESKEFKLAEDFIKNLPERKNMRVAKMKYIIIPSEVSFSPGRYNIKIDEKEYNLTIRKDIDDDSYMPADLMRIK